MIFRWLKSIRGHEVEDDWIWIDMFDRYDAGPEGWEHEAHEERVDWLVAHVGQGSFRTYMEDSDLEPGVARIYGFRDAKQAMLFKLTWGGR